MHNTNNTGKEQIINIDNESRDLVTIGSNEEMFIPTFNNTKRIQQQPFQVLNEDDENLTH